MTSLSCYLIAFSITPANCQTNPSFMTCINAKQAVNYKFVSTITERDIKSNMID